MIKIMKIILGITLAIIGLILVSASLRNFQIFDLDFLSIFSFILVILFGIVFIIFSIFIFVEKRVNKNLLLFLLSLLFGISIFSLITSFNSLNAYDRSWYYLMLSQLKGHLINTILTTIGIILTLKNKF